jgi:hypothetical protein
MTANGPTYCDVRDAKARERHVPFSCPDKTLTAFCQLGALRFNVRRCLLFFFDVNYAYIMAEATRSLSLEDDNAHDPGDQLWLGHAKIPRGIACCEVTVGLPSFPITVTKANGDRDSVYVVEDLTKNLTTQDKPMSHRSHMVVSMPEYPSPVPTVSTSEPTACLETIPVMAFQTRTLSSYET